ncbi:MAG: RsmB/NOP family class I SAM-dependent RNA methyltransferase [Candidatus Woesearchaeota archaeon]
MIQFPEFKEKFIERYSKLTNFQEFKEASLKQHPKSIRTNTLKITPTKLKQRLKEFKLKQIPWCKEGFWVEGERTDLGNLPEHGLGYFYIQEASSMLPSIALDPKKGDFVLDIAAAPGSKTTHLAALMKNTGLIIANDPDYKRIKALNMNIQRSGITNTIITKMPGRFFKNLNFDKILLDAPCSGTGTIRKSPRTILEWNPNNIKRIAGIQRQLIKTSFENLKKGGILVYSTCTLEPLENEGIVSHLLENYPNAKLEKINIKIKSSPAILEFEDQKFDPEVKKCLRIWPQDNNTDGFFVAKILKS